MLRHGLVMCLIQRKNASTNARVRKVTWVVRVETVEWVVLVVRVVRVVRVVCKCAGLQVRGRLRQEWRDRRDWLFGRVGALGALALLARGFAGASSPSASHDYDEAGCVAAVAAFITN